MTPRHRARRADASRRRGALGASLWRKYPRLNSWFFPDINGVWVGKTRSNWPVIDKLRHAANLDEETLLRELTRTPLQEDVIVMEIKASLFSVHVKAYLANTGATSSSVTAKAQKKVGTVQLFYVYHQDTPEVVETDESLHLGAAELDFEPARLAETRGVYWTRRSWRQGLNTAGLLELRRAGEHDEGKSLAEYAAEAVAGQDGSTPRRSDGRYLPRASNRCSRMPLSFMTWLINLSRWMRSTWA